MSNDEIDRLYNSIERMSDKISLLTAEMAALNERVAQMPRPGARPCPDLQRHIDAHQKTENRVWEIFSRYGIGGMIGAITGWLASHLRG